MNGYCTEHKKCTILKLLPSIFSLKKKQFSSTGSELTNWKTSFEKVEQPKRI